MPTMIRSLLKRWKGGMPEDGSASTASVVPGERPPADSRERARSLVMALQDEICAGLEQIDGSGRFQEESWERPEGGGGRSRVMREGRIFEQGGVNFSEVQGQELPPSILKQRPEAKALAAKLLEEIAGQELAYSRASERKATEAEQDLGKIVELIPHGEDEPPEDAA